MVVPLEKYSGLHTSQTNPIVHYGWCKHRAYEELKAGNIGSALNNFSSDMLKNTKTADSFKTMMSFISCAKDNRYECLKFISGFVFDGSEDSLSDAEKTSLEALMREEGELANSYFLQLLKDAKKPFEAEMNQPKKATEAPKKLSSKTENFFKGIFR